eukprot:XP_015580095.1 eukaryotic translation initiation factor 4 gamma [Ricinus communis]
MDAYQQQHHRYMRPMQPQPTPPPSVPPSNSDPHHHYLHHQPRPPVPPQGTWYSDQFQYHPPQQPPSSHSPSPPPQQWAAPPPPPAYPPPPPPPHPYPAHQQFPPPPPPRPPPPPHSQIFQPYPPINQEWGNSNWGQQQQSWDYQAHNNAEDWAARARAWAAQKAAMDDQYPQSQFTQAGRMEEQNRVHEQYQQTADSHYQDFQQQQFPVSGYQQFSVSAAASHQPPISYLQENASFNPGPSSNVPDSRMSYTVGGGTSAGAPTTSPSVLQQEVPSSYSSVTGQEEVTNQKDQLYKSFPLPMSSSHEGQHHMQLPLPAVGGSVLTEQPYSYSNQGADPTSDLSDQPSDFAPSFTRDQDPHMQSSYAAHDSTGNGRGLGPVTPLPSINSWTPTGATGSVYAPIPPGLPSGHQHDPSVAMPSPVSGQAALPFGSFPGPNFQPTISAVGLSYGVGPGSALHATAGFVGDAYGVSNLSERPKKASVPNWLKEEIIKNASVISRSSLEHPKEETQSIEDECVDRLYVKGDQADSKSIDSSRSTEEEDEDEDDDEAARTAAINQEIKRVLTEVLLKVTDELFDEIATKVLDEHDLTVEVEHNTGTASNTVSPSPLEVPAPKASAKVLGPIKAKEPETEDVSEKSSSSAPGNILGLANYASDDDDEDDEIKSSSISNFRKNIVLQQSNSPRSSKDMHYAAENGSSQLELGKHRKQSNLETDLSKTSSVESKNQINAALSDLSEHKYSSKVVSQASDVENNVDSGKALHTTDESGSRATLGENVADDFQDKATKVKSDEDGQHESKRSYSVKDIKDTELNRENEKGDGNRRKQDETHSRKEKKDDRNGSKEKVKEQGDKTGGKAKESELRKRPHLDVKEDRRELEKLHRSNAKEDDNRKRRRTKDKEDDRARHKPTNDSSKHKRRRSSSTSSRGRNSRDKDSSDEASDGSKRKTHSRKRNLSPSPVRSRRRQVSRSPHSKHSQRRHSPYSSLETTRRKRSRSKSPVRRHR